MNSIFYPVVKNPPANAGDKSSIPGHSPKLRSSAWEVEVGAGLQPHTPPLAKPATLMPPGCKGIQGFDGR